MSEPWHPDWKLCARWCAERPANLNYWDAGAFWTALGWAYAPAAPAEIAEAGLTFPALCPIAPVGGAGTMGPGWIWPRAAGGFVFECRVGRAPETRYERDAVLVDLLRAGPDTALRAMLERMEVDRKLCKAWKAPVPRWLYADACDAWRVHRSPTVVLGNLRMRAPMIDRSKRDFAIMVPALAEQFALTMRRWLYDKMAKDGTTPYRDYAAREKEHEAQILAWLREGMDSAAGREWALMALEKS